MEQGNIQADVKRLWCRLLVAFTLMLMTFSVNAEGGDSVCAGFYPKSGAVAGTAACYITAVSNTPIGMSAYYCVNEPARIRRWCGTPPDLAQADAACPVADPVNPNSGTTTLTENDFASGDDIPVLFSRTYRSRGFFKPDAGLGASWFHNWQRQLGLAKFNNSSPQITAFREDGDAVVFGKSNGAWRSIDGKLFALSQSPTTWALTDLSTGAVESYSLQGVLLSVSVHDGRLISLIYSDSNTSPDVAPSPGLLIAITGHAPGSNPAWDLTFRLSYDAKWRITQMTDPTGRVTRYGYDGNNNLVSVTWPDGSVRQYAYADTRFTSALTDVIDEAGSRVSTWVYDAQGRAISVSHPDTTRNVSFAYGGTGTRVNYGQKSLLMGFEPSANRVRPTVTSSSTGASGSIWDVAGNLLSQTGASGLGRNAVYDDVGRPTRATHLGLNGTTVTTVRYADGNSLRPSMIASPGWVRAFVYDAHSNLTGLSEWTTRDTTGESGFDASADGMQKISYGFAYDSANQLDYAQVYGDGKLIEEWSMTRDPSGNLRQMQNRTTGSYYTVTVRDGAHRAVQIDAPGGIALPVYDSRGRLGSFWYNELASPLNGNTGRLLKINFGYSPDGRLLFRTGTVSLNNGADTSIGSNEIDQWISNWNSGVVPVGPPRNLRGLVKMLRADAEPGLAPTLAPWDAVFAASRFAWMIYLISREDPAGILVDKLKPEIETKKCVDVPAQLTMEEISGILRDAIKGRDDFAMGSATAADAEALGEAWVGPNPIRSITDETILISKDGLRQYRPPSSKNSPYSTTGIQANFQSRTVPSGKWVNNGHLNIAP